MVRPRGFQMGQQTVIELSPVASETETNAFGELLTAAAGDTSQRLARGDALAIPQRIGDASLIGTPELVRTGQPPGSAALAKVLNLAEAAAFVRCSRAHLSNIVNGKIRGIPHLPAVRIGRRVLFRRESLETWLHQVESATPARTPR
jgi:excisionase family DNA binding protein